jgi:hypothetical protein
MEKVIDGKYHEKLENLKSPSPGFRYKVWVLTYLKIRVQNLSKRRSFVHHDDQKVPILPKEKLRVLRKSKLYRRRLS